MNSTQRMPKRVLALASDHAGFELKEWIKENTDFCEWADFGPNHANRVDYPDFASVVAQAVSNGTFERGLLICGSGLGMAIAANKFRGVRAAPVQTEEAARLAKQHNDANVLCLGARLISKSDALAFVRAWFESEFEGGRHLDRVQKISKLEKR
jgi:ribose 5-phosphate isomerase B